MRKAGRMLRDAVGRGGRNAIPQRVNRDTEEASGIDQMLRRASVAEIWDQVLARAIHPGGHEHHVVCCGVELAEGAVTNTAIVDRLAALELAFAKLRDLLLAILSLHRKGGEDSHHEHATNRSLMIRAIVIPWQKGGCGPMAAP